MSQPPQLDLSAVLGAASNLSPDAKLMLLQQLQQQLGLPQPHTPPMPAPPHEPAAAPAPAEVADVAADDAVPAAHPASSARREHTAAAAAAAAPPYFSKLKHHHTMPHPRKNTPVPAHAPPSITPSSPGDEEPVSVSGMFDSLKRLPSSLTSSGHFGSPSYGSPNGGSLVNTKSSAASMSLTSTMQSTSHTPSGATHPGLLNSASSVGMGLGGDSTGRGGRFRRGRLSAQDDSDDDTDVDGDGDQDHAGSGGGGGASDALDERDVSLGLQQHAYDTDDDSAHERKYDSAEEDGAQQLGDVRIDLESSSVGASGRRRSISSDVSAAAAATATTAAAAAAAPSPLTQAPGGPPISSRGDKPRHSRSSTPDSPSTRSSSLSPSSALASASASAASPAAAQAHQSPRGASRSSHSAASAAAAAHRSSSRSLSRGNNLLASSTADYALGDQIGSGVFGKVFRATERQSGSAVAVKVVVFDPTKHTRNGSGGSGGHDSSSQHDSHSSTNNSNHDVDCREEVRREVCAWAAMLAAHPTPNLLPVYGALAHGPSQLWIVSQLQELGSCADVLARRRKAGLLPAAPAPAAAGQQFMPERLTAAVLRGALLGLEQLYACYPAAGAGGAAASADLPGHGSVRCSTLLLDASGSVRLADRAAAQRLDATFKPAGMSLVYYMSPEAIAEPSSAPRPRDVWGVGIAAIELIEGAPPHAGLLPLRVCSLIPRGPAPSLRHPAAVSADMLDFVARCCAKQPSQRWTVAQLLQHPLIVAAADVPASDLAAFASEYL